MKLTSLTRALALAALVVGAARASVTIDNDIPEGQLGHWSVWMEEGGYSDDGTLTALRLASGDIVTENVIYDWRTWIDVGPLGGEGVFALEDMEGTVALDPNDSDTAVIRGSFEGANGNTINYETRCSIPNASSLMTCRMTLTAGSESALGAIRVMQYLDEDVEGAGDDVFQARGAAGAGTLELLTVDEEEVYGVSHGGAYSAAQGLVNATFAGWAADEYDNMQDVFESGAVQAFSPAGVIQTLQQVNHPFLGAAYGPEDVVSALAWDVSASARTATIVYTLGGVPQAPPPTKTCAAGDVWPEGGDGSVDLRDMLRAVRMATGRIPPTQADIACGDVSPGRADCVVRTPFGRRTSWCPQPDGRFSIGDLQVIFREALGIFQVGCNQCEQQGRTSLAPGAMRRPGDIVQDGTVDIADAVRALRMSVGLDEAMREDMIRGDVAPLLAGPDGAFDCLGNGTVDVADVVSLMRTAVGLNSLRWPARTITVQIDAGAPVEAAMVGMSGWPDWAEPVSVAGSGCTGSFVHEDGAWAWNCMTDDGPMSGMEDVMFTYRAPEPVSPADLACDARTVGTDMVQQRPMMRMR